MGVWWSEWWACAGVCGGHVLGCAVGMCAGVCGGRVLGCAVGVCWGVWWACAGVCGGRVVDGGLWWVVVGGEDRCTCDVGGLFWFEEWLPSRPLPLPHPSAILNDLVVSGEVGGVLHGRGDRAVFTPHIYSRAQNSWVDAFYSANGYLGEHTSRWA